MIGLSNAVVVVVVDVVVSGMGSRIVSLVLVVGLVVFFITDRPSQFFIDTVPFKTMTAIVVVHFIVAVAAVVVCNVVVVNIIVFARRFHRIKVDGLVLIQSILVVWIPEAVLTLDLGTAHPFCPRRLLFHKQLVMIRTLVNALVDTLKVVQVQLPLEAREPTHAAVVLLHDGRFKHLNVSNHKGASVRQETGNVCATRDLFELT